MLDSYYVTCLTNDGFDMSEITAATEIAESTGSAELGGYIIRYNEEGRLIIVHPDWCGIYCGDYNSHIIFDRFVEYTTHGLCFARAKYRELESVLEKLNSEKKNDFILCECSYGNFNRRKKQVEKFGYTVKKSNESACRSESATCVFLIS